MVASQRKGQGKVKSRGRKASEAKADEEVKGWKKGKPKFIEAEILFTEDVLGTCPGDPDILQRYVVEKMLEETPRTEEEQAEEMAAVETAIEKTTLEEEIVKSTTFFPRVEDGTPFLWNYQVRGTIKEAASAYKRATNDPLWRPYKKICDLLIFSYPRRVPLILPAGYDGDNKQFLQRPVRAPTPQGERVFILRSEVIPAGTTAKFGIVVLSEELEPFVRMFLDYGMLHGFLQWRNGGYGTYDWRQLDKSEEIPNPYPTLKELRQGWGKEDKAYKFNWDVKSRIAAA